MIKPENFDLLEHISLEDQRDIVQSITKAEFNTTGEIRVHIESTANGDAQERAKKVFEILEMHKTEARNGVLFYLAVCDRCFAIIGDRGIHEKV
ncbi:MAG: TPM domain-containing protein, partial [Flavobacteriaceae bacterium]|nr:TPM domain-containing protein [Flavobacteriaceae bacterium]